MFITFILDVRKLLKNKCVEILILTKKANLGNIGPMIPWSIKKGRDTETMIVVGYIHVL